MVKLKLKRKRKQGGNCDNVLINHHHHDLFIIIMPDFNQHEFSTQLLTRKRLCVCVCVCVSVQYNHHQRCNESTFFRGRVSLSRTWVRVKVRLDYKENPIPRGAEIESQSNYRLALRHLAYTITFNLWVSVSHWDEKVDTVSTQCRHRAVHVACNADIIHVS